MIQTVTDVLKVLLLYDHDRMSLPGALYDLYDSRASQRFFCLFIVEFYHGHWYHLCFYLDLIPRHAQPQFVLSDII